MEGLPKIDRKENTVFLRLFSLVRFEVRVSGHHLGVVHANWPIITDGTLLGNL